MQIKTWEEGVTECKRERAAARARQAKADQNFANLRELADASEQLGAVLDRLACWVNGV